MSEKAYEVAHLDELDRFPVDDEGLLWRPVRRRLGITAFGTNAYTAEKGDERVVEEHYEKDGHEELYFVASGRATFVLGDDEIDAPAGTFVHAEPGTKRGAVATEPNTTVLAIGAKPGVPHEISKWEDIFVVFGLYRTGKEAEAREHLEKVLAENPDVMAGLLQRRLLRGADRQRRRCDRAAEARDRARPPGARVRGRTTRTSTACATGRTSPHERHRPHLRPRVQVPERTSRWAMVRTHFDIQSFGVNAYIADGAGRGGHRRARRARRARGQARGALLRRRAATRRSPSTATRSTRRQARSSSSAIRPRSARRSPRRPGRRS